MARGCDADERTASEMSRTRRKPYRGSKAIDASCRSHGDCPWCQRKRKAKHERHIPADAKEQTEEHA